MLAFIYIAANVAFRYNVYKQRNTNTKVDDHPHPNCKL